MGRGVVEHLLSGHAGHGFLKQMVDGHKGRAVPGPVGEMGDDLLRGVLLGALEKVGGGGRGDHAVLQHHIADLDGAQERFVFQFHEIVPFRFVLHSTL